MSMDGTENGAFAERVLKDWNKGAYRLKYVTLHAAIKAGMPATQSPNLFPLGPATFAREQPFKV